MGFKFNPLTGQLDLVGGGSSVSSFDVDSILTGPTECDYSGPTAPLEVLIDDNGNVITGE